MKNWLARRLPEIWYSDEKPPLWLRLLEWPVAAWIRRSSGRPQSRPPIPVVVVGNLTAGGTGKTPLVIHLARALGTSGIRCGVISRGYGGRRKRADEPFSVERDDDARRTGDEPLLIRRAAGVPVWVGRDRARALSAAVDAGVEVVISDDGLQHSNLPRSVEICVIDGKRRFGNGHFLPAGPLRDPPERLESVDLVVCRTQDGSRAHAGEVVLWLKPACLVNLQSGRQQPPEFLADKPVHAVAAIGHPESFFRLLESLHYSIHRHPWPDHRPPSATELKSLDGPVIMTAKDAVHFPAAEAAPDWWYLDVEAGLDTVVQEKLLDQIRSHSGKTP